MNAAEAILIQVRPWDSFTCNKPSLEDAAQIIEEKMDGEIKAAARYEVLRTFNVNQFHEIYSRNIMNGERFDDMIDDIVDANRKAKAK